MPTIKARLRHLTWEGFEERINQGPPSLEPIRGSPRAEIFIAPQGAKIGLRVLGAVKALPPSPLAELSIRAGGTGSNAFVEIATSNPLLYREFYSFCCAVADRIQIGGREISGAIAETLERWTSLLRRRPLMTDQKVVGLLGELWFLRRLAGRRGWPFAARAWRGPDAEEHDFTLSATDVEVKTTAAETRRHTISSLTQLMPKHRRELMLLSIQLTPVSPHPEALALQPVILKILADAARSSRQSAASIESQIEHYGWHEDEASFYNQAFDLRSTPMLVKVGRSFPAIVPRTLQSLGPDRLSRIEGVSYVVNVDGLGVADGKRAFQTSLGR